MLGDFLNTPVLDLIRLVDVHTSDLHNKTVRAFRSGCVSSAKFPSI